MIYEVFYHCHFYKLYWAYILSLLNARFPINHIIVNNFRGFLSKNSCEFFLFTIEIVSKGITFPEKNALYYHHKKRYEQVHNLFNVHKIKRKKSAIRITNVKKTHVKSDLWFYIEPNNNQSNIFRKHLITIIASPYLRDILNREKETRQ